jgi:hypothetical protein
MASKQRANSELEVVGKPDDPPVVMPPCKAEDNAEHAEVYHPESLRLACPRDLLGKSLPRVDAALYGYRPRASCHTAAELYALEVAQHRALCAAAPSEAAALLQAAHARPHTAPQPTGPKSAPVGVLTPRPPATPATSTLSARTVGGFHTGDCPPARHAAIIDWHRMHRQVRKRAYSHGLCTRSARPSPWCARPAGRRRGPRRPLSLLRI